MSSNEIVLPITLEPSCTVSYAANGFQNFPPRVAAMQATIVTQQPLPVATTIKLVSTVENWLRFPHNHMPGLDFLKTLNKLVVKQKVDLVQVLTRCEKNNRYDIHSGFGHKIFRAEEENDCCTRNVFRQSRPFNLVVYDNFQNEIMQMYRPLACSRCCFPCCLQAMLVYAPPGQLAGIIEQEWGLCSSSFRIKNHDGELVLRIEGTCCSYTICGRVDYEVISLSGHRVARISKKWSGFWRECCTDADFYDIKFPFDLDVRMKAVLLGATFLIDMMFYERKRRILKC